MNGYLYLLIEVNEKGEEHHKIGIFEKWLHSKFYNKKTLSENEWFKLSDEDVINFLDTCKKMDDTIEMLIRENSFYREIL